MATGGQINTDILSDQTFDVLCTICKNKGKNSEGEKFCIECQDYFCLKCAPVHSQVLVCVGHNDLDKSLDTSRISKGQPRGPAERCDRHSHKHIDMYCQNHDSIGCSTCMAVDHRTCQDICYIPEFIQNNTYHAASGDIQTKLKEISKTLAEQTTKFKQDKQRLLKRKTQLLTDIRKFRQEINDQLDVLEKNSIDEIEDKVKHLEDKIEDNLKKLQANMARVTSANDKLASPNTNQAELFVHLKVGEDAANFANKCIEDNKNKGTENNIDFQRDETILAWLEQYKALGTLTEIPIKIPCTSFLIKGERSYFDTNTYDIGLLDSFFGSSYCLKDGAIILADRNNRMLKRYHSNNYTVTDYGLPAQPWQVCSINTAQVAVSIPTYLEVRFISVAGQMTTTNKINTTFACYGLAYSNDNLYISDQYTKVYIFTLSGKKLKKIKKQSLLKVIINVLTDQTQFINSLAVSKDATRIYMTDTDQGLIVLDNNGKVISTLNPKRFGHAFCYLTEAGSVLVSGLHSNDVLLFTSDGVLLREIIEADSGKGDIASVCCNQQMSKLYVSRINDNNIEVYDI